MGLMQPRLIEHYVAEDDFELILSHMLAYDVCAQTGFGEERQNRVRELELSHTLCMTLENALTCVIHRFLIVRLVAI